MSGAMRRGLRRGLTIVGAALIALALGLGVRLWLGAGDEKLGQAGIGGPFMLINQDGRTVSDRDFRGRLMLVYFGYTYCPDVCPTELQNMALALDALGADAAKVQPIFVTIDPARDTPEQLKSYVASFHDRLIGLGGSAEAIAAAAKAYRVYYARGGGSGADYLMDHSGFVYLIGRDGAYVAHFRPGTPPEQIAARIRAAL
jgi:protein SCO1/2